MSRSDARGKGMSREDSLKRVLLFAMLSVMLTAVASTVVEAAAMDSVRNAWGSMRVYVLSGPFWINALIVFAGIFLLYTLLLSSKLGGSDSTTKVIMYIVIGIIALVIATKFIDPATGAPEYIWHNDQFRMFTRFLIGPEAGQGPGACAAPEHSWWRSWVPFGLAEPNPPCCGAGAYFTQAHGRQDVCKQAILRTNDNGVGLPAFIIATILFYLLFASQGKKLGFDSMGSSGGKWFPIVLSVVLGAMMANERVAKNNILIIGGWIALVMLGNKLSKTLGGEGGAKDEKGDKRGFGFGLAYALIQLILNMLGTSLWGGNVTSSDIGTGTILWNILIGFGMGWIYSVLTGEKGVLGAISKARREKAAKDIEDLTKKGKYKQAFLRGLPIIGSKWSPEDKAEKLRKDVREITDDIEMVRRLYNVKTDTSDPALTREIDEKVKRLEKKLADALKKTP